MTGDGPPSAEQIAFLEGDGGLYRVRWDDLRFLLVTVERGSFRSAADALGCSMNTIRNRIDTLERITGELLLNRSVEGVQPTLEGQRLARAAEKMRAASLEAETILRRKSDSEATGEVTLSVTEGLGTAWLIPRLTEFGRDHPSLTIDLRCDLYPPDIARHQADISIQLERPERPELLIQRLGFIHFMPFASQNYLAAHGVPSPAKGVSGHRWVEQRAPQLADQRLDHLFKAGTGPQALALGVNTSPAHFWAIAHGAGIGILPTYIRAVSKTVRPVEIGVFLRREIWVTFHPDMKRSKKVELVLRWLRECFDPRRFPWFGEAFVHPDDLEAYFDKRAGLGRVEARGADSQKAHRV